MVTELHEKLAELDKIESPGEMILSVYVSPGSDFVSGRALGATIDGLLQPIEGRWGGETHGARMAVRNATARIRELEPRIAAEAGKTVALFIGGDAGLDEFIVLPGRGWDVAVAGSRPYLRPFRAILGMFETIATVLVDPRRTEIAVSHMGQTLERVAVTAQPVRKPVVGGWHGLDEHRSRNHTEQVHTRHYRAVADRLGRLARQHEIKAVFVGGREEAVSELLAQLTEPVSRLVAGSFPIDLHTALPAAVAAQAAAMEQEHQQAVEQDLITTTLDLARAGGLAVTGLAGTIEAANLGAVNTMIVAGTGMEPGWSCGACGWLGLTGPECGACGETAGEIADLIDALIVRALSQGAVVVQVLTPNELDGEKVAAQLRFRPGPPKASSE